MNCVDNRFWSTKILCLPIWGIHWMASSRCKQALNGSRIWLASELAVRFDWLRSFTASRSTAGMHTGQHPHSAAFERDALVFLGKGPCEMYGRILLVQRGLMTISVCPLSFARLSLFYCVGPIKCSPFVDASAICEWQAACHHVMPQVLNNQWFNCTPITAQTPNISLCWSVCRCLHDPKPTTTTTVCERDWTVDLSPIFFVCILYHFKVEFEKSSV